MRDETRIECHTPTPGKQPTTVPKWKYNAVKAAIRKVVSDAGSSGALFKTLPNQVRSRLDPAILDDLGSVTWMTTTVKLDMEVRGALQRIDSKEGQRLVLAGK